MSQNFSKQAFEKATQVASKRCLLIGHAPPHVSNTSRHAVRLLHMLRAAGATVQMASVGVSPLIGRIVSFGSETDLSRSVADVSLFKPERVFLYVPAMNFGDCEQANWLRRRLEELRRLRFAFKIARDTPEVTLICDPPNYRPRTQAGVVIAAMLGALSKRRVAKLKLRTSLMGQLAPDIIDASVPAPDAIVAERAFFTQSPQTIKRMSAARLTPTLAQNALDLARKGAGNPVNVDFLDEVQLLTKAARDHSADHLPLVRLLRRQSLQSSADVIGPPASRAYDVANRIATEGSQFALPITRFMMHLRMSLRLERQYTLKTRNDARSFLNWYRDKGPSKSCGGALPEPLPILNAMPRSESTRRRSADWGRLAHLTNLDMRPFPIPPAFLTSQDCLPEGRFDLETQVGRIAWAFEQVLLRVSEGSSLDELGDGALEWLAKPIAGRGRNPSRFEYLMALQCRRCLKNGRDFLTPWQGETTRGWFDAFAMARASGLARFSQGPNLAAPKAHRIDVVGLAQQSTGIAINFEMSKRALQSSNLPVTMRDAEAGYASTECADLAAPVILRRSAALFHLNADRIPQALVAPVFSARRDLYNIGFLLWEFSQLPKAHALALDMLDEIWVPSQFLQSAYGAMCDKPVTLVGKGLELPDVAVRSLWEFGMQPASVTFLTCFDIHSSVERKNPLAAVLAFQAAFPVQRQDVQLIVKTTPKLNGHWGDPNDQLGQIRKLASKDRRIKILSKFLPQDEFLSLIRSVDCMISPHRAEGFGYIPAYALYYGVPVVNTDFSGVTDYCTPQTALPVPYKLVDVPAGHAIYPLRGAKWADVDIDALAMSLKDVAERPTAAKQRALVGRSLMLSQYSIEALQERYLRRFSEIGLLKETDLKFCSRNVHADE